MRNSGDDRRANGDRRFWEMIFPLGFGLALLAFLTAIERPAWFHIRPASGTAQAMAYAADAHAKPVANGQAAPAAAAR